MTVWQWQAMLIEHNQMMDRKPKPMSDEEFDDAKDRIRAMNLPDVKI